MNRLLTLHLLLICTAFGFSQSVHKNYVDGMIYVRVSPETLKPISFENPRNIPLEKFSLLQKVVSNYSIQKVSRPFFQAKEDSVLPYILKLEFSSIKRVHQLIEDLTRIKGVLYAEKVPLMAIDAVPNDPLFSTAGGSVHLNQINAQSAWNVFNGTSTITIAIVDNAVMWTHVDLIANTYTNTGEIPSNSIDDDGNGYIDDVNGFDVSDYDNNAVPTNSLMDHGTHCAGIAGASTDNTVGIASIGWNLKIIPVKCQTNGGSTSTVANGYEGIVYAVKAKAKIISCSWGGSASSITEQSVVNYAWNRGCIVFASAGNLSSSTPNYPGAYSNVYCVASVGPTDLISSFSNYGTWVDISAPGNTITSTVPYTTTPAYVQKSGTSMATPLVAGLAGLMLSKSPNMTRTDVLNCISSTAVNIYTVSGNGAYSTGNQLGAGRIDAFAAMTCAASYSAIPPVANFFANNLFACPGTTIQFSDSSLYQPTSWNWTFQGGTPSTSTLTNPSVLWASPGTYSVMLTVANANGNNSKTKLAYITVAGPLPLPFFEGFQNSTFLPANWTPNNILNDNIYWERKTGVGGFATSTACAIFDNYTYYAPGERDEMRSPKFNFSNVATARLRFDVAYARYDAFFSDSLEVKLSTNCGSTWTSIYIKGGSTLATAPDNSAPFSPTNVQWRRDTIDISLLTAGQGNVMFAFINRGHYGQTLYLDNINLVFPTPSLSFANPSSVCNSSTVSFTNTSSGASGYTWSAVGGSPSSGTGTNFSSSFASSGVYSVSVLGVNGTTTTQITNTILVTNNPSLSVNSPSLCSGSSATLTANGATTYSWSTGATGSVLVVNPNANVSFTLTGSNGGSCLSTTVSNVSVVSTPTLTVSNQTICSGGTASVAAQGAPSYSWNTGSTSATLVITPSASAVYTVTGTNLNCASSQTVSVQLAAPLPITITPNNSVICVGSSATLSVLGASSYTWSSGATGSVLVVSPLASTLYTVLGTIGTCTGSASSAILVNANPTISVNSQTLCAGSTITLQALGANTFTWNTGAQSASLAVNPVVTTIYTVSGTSNSCTSTKTVSAFIGGALVQLTVSASAASICAGNSATLTANGALSYSWTNGSTTSVIVVNPTTTTNYSVTGMNGSCSGTSSLAVAVLQAPSLSITTTPSQSICLGSSVTLSAAGNYSVYTWSNPTVNNSSVIVSPSVSTSYSIVASGAPAGCTSSTVVLITVNANPISQVSSTNTGCGTSCKGIVNASSSGGIAPYTFSLSGSSCSVLPCINLCAGLYTLFTSDASGCSSFNIFSVSPSSNNLTVAFTTTNASCGSCANGILNAGISGGTLPYSYTWAPIGGNTAVANNLTPGCYTVTIVDAAECTLKSSSCVNISIGIEEILEGGKMVILFPNPTEELLTFGMVGDTFDYTLYSNLGQIVSQSQNEAELVTLNVQTFAKGIYLLELNTSHATYRKKIVIK